MAHVSVRDAKTHLEELLAALDDGREREIRIARAGLPDARVVLDEHRRADVPDVSRRIGIAKGKFPLPADFDADNPRIQRMFEGGKGD